MVNDITIIATIIGIFLIVGTLLPFINEAFGVSPEETSCFRILELEANLGNVSNVLEDEDSSPTLLRPLGSVGIFDVMGSIVKMFFWTCGALPLLIDLFFLLLRIVLLVIIVRNVWVGGGG